MKNLSFLFIAAALTFSLVSCGDQLEMAEFEKDITSVTKDADQAVDDDSNLSTAIEEPNKTVEKQSQSFDQANPNQTINGEELDAVDAGAYEAPQVKTKKPHHGIDKPDVKVQLQEDEGGIDPADLKIEVASCIRGGETLTLVHPNPDFRMEYATKRYQVIWVAASGKVIDKGIRLSCVSGLGKITLQVTDLQTRATTQLKYYNRASDDAPDMK